MNIVEIYVVVYSLTQLWANKDNFVAWLLTNDN